MGKVNYEMSKTMYNMLKNPMVWNAREQRMMKKGKPLTEKEVLDIINTQFGLKFQVGTISLI